MTGSIGYQNAPAFGTYAGCGFFGNVTSSYFTPDARGLDGRGHRRHATQCLCRQPVNRYATR